MSDPDYYTYVYWKDIIDELDMCDDLHGKSIDFVISLKEKKPKTLSLAQVKWLEDLKERHLL